MNSCTDIKDSTMPVIIVRVKYVAGLGLKVDWFYDSDVDLHGVYCYRPDNIWARRGSRWRTEINCRQAAEVVRVRVRKILTSN